MGKTRRNAQQFTTDEIRTATLLITEGSSTCVGILSTKKYKGKTYRYTVPRLRVEVKMCDKEALEPASRVFGTKIIPYKNPKIVCNPEIYPDPRTDYRVVTVGAHAQAHIQKLKPLLTRAWLKKYERTVRRCTK